MAYTPYVDQVLQDIETIFSDDITLNSFNLSKLVPAAVTDFPRQEKKNLLLQFKSLPDSKLQCWLNCCIGKKLAERSTKKKDTKMVFPLLRACDANTHIFKYSEHVAKFYAYRMPPSNELFPRYVSSLKHGIGSTMLEKLIAFFNCHANIIVQPEAIVKRFFEYERAQKIASILSFKV